MNIPTFITLLAFGVIVGILATLTGRGPELPFALNRGASSGGAFVGWWVLRQIKPAAIQAGFALSGNVTLLVLLRGLKN